MAEATRRYTDDVPDDLTARVRELCLGLPDAYEEQAWVGTRWRIRTRTFAHVLGISTGGAASSTVLAFRSAGEELEALRHAGPPFLVLGWGRAAMGMVLDAATDWDEVQELVIESYCTQAPKMLIARLDRPAGERR